MKVHIEILDDKDEVVFEQTGDASQPLQWRTTSGQKFLSPMPPQSDQAATGTYELFGFTFQPIVRVDRPNGYTPPAPSPVSGQNTSLPTNFPQIARGTGYGQQKSWGTSAPTPPITTNPTFLGATPTQRG